MTGQLRTGSNQVRRYSWLLYCLVLCACAAAPQAASTVISPAPPSPASVFSASNSPVHSVELDNQIATGLTLDRTHVYWITPQDPQHIFSYPLTGGLVTTAVSSRFSDGDLTTMRPIRSGDWLIFLDTPTASGNATWVLRALNLLVGTEQIIGNVQDDPASWPGPEVSADGAQVVWTRLQSSQHSACVETILTSYNLTSGQSRELNRGCVEGHYRWSYPALSGDRLLVEQDSVRSDEDISKVILFDLNTGRSEILNPDYPGSMPIVSGSWAVWKAASRFQWGREVVIYNLDRREGRLLQSPGASPLDPLLVGLYLYWPPSAQQPFFVYDIKRDELLTIATPSENEDIVSVAIYGGTVAWCRDLNAQNANVHHGLLEWQELPRR